MTTSLKIEHYVLGKTIGMGASSKVKSNANLLACSNYPAETVARHEYCNTNVAIKIINKKKMKNSNMSAKIKREIRLLRYFNHPNIIRLYEVLETQSDIYVVMEYISGGELFELIAQRGKMQEAEARLLFQQIVSGVEYCHLNLVAHRDLKPENILVDHNNVVRIADFGLSNLMKDGKFLKSSCGSPNYAAPEIISGKKYCGTEIDTWSCGVILFALVAGFLPFDEELIPALFKKIREADYHTPSHVPTIVADLIHRMLQPDPINRINFCMIKKHPWLSDTTPLYMQISLMSARSWCSSKIDEEIFRKMAQIPFNFHNLTEMQIRESILRRKDFSFVIGYDLMMNEKIKAQLSAEKSNQKEEEQRKADLLTIQTSPVLKLQTMIEHDIEHVTWGLDRIKEVNLGHQQGPWQYGLVFSAQPQFIMRVVAEVLGELDTTFVMKSADYKIKCFHRLHKRIYEGSGSAIYDISAPPPIHPDKYAQTKENKFSMTEINFNLQIYKLPNFSDHLVDIQRTKGQCIVFLDYCHNFEHLLTVKMKKYLSQVQLNEMIEVPDEYDDEDSLDGQILTQKPS